MEAVSISLFGPQDNALIHIFRNLQLWFLRQPFILQPWLDQSLDMGSIEHLWTILKKKLNQYKTPPKRLIGLWFCIKEIFSFITPNHCKRLVQSMSRQFVVLLVAKRKWILYLSTLYLVAIFMNMHYIVLDKTAFK